MERLVSREKTKKKEKSRANDAAKAAATVESAAPSVVSSSSVHARAGSSFSDIAQSSPLARPSPSSSGTSTSRQILPKERAIGKSFIVDTPQWEHALKEDARRRKELEKVVEQKKDEGAKKERDDEKSANVNAKNRLLP